MTCLCEYHKCKNPAHARITYGLYSAYAAGRPHHIVSLCDVHSKELWEGTETAGSLKEIVAAGLCHYIIEPIESVVTA